MNLTEAYSTNKDLLDSLSYIKKRLDIYKQRKESLSKTVCICTDDIAILNKRKQLIDSAKQYYLKVVDMCYAYSIEEMENFVNYVLAYVFYDESYKIRLDISNKRNKSMTFYLIDETRGLELPLRKGSGKGVKAVVSFILLTYYLLRMRTPYIFLDESFVNISACYVERFFDYVKKLCHDYNLCIVLITHDTRFPEFADKIYNVRKGVVTCVYDNAKV